MSEHTKRKASNTFTHNSVTAHGMLCTLLQYLRQGTMLHFFSVFARLYFELKIIACFMQSTIVQSRANKLTPAMCKTINQEHVFF